MIVTVAREAQEGGEVHRHKGPPWTPLPNVPPPQGNPPRAAQETDRDRDPLFTMSVKKETQRAGVFPWAPEGRLHPA